MSSFAKQVPVLKKTWSELMNAVSNVPSNFIKSVCTKNFLCAKFYQHLYLQWHVWNMRKNTFRTNISVRFMFSCLRSSHGLCARAA